jgi:hypothetical protein
MTSATSIFAVSLAMRRLSWSAWISRSRARAAWIWWGLQTASGCKRGG